MKYITTQISQPNYSVVTGQLCTFRQITLKNYLINHRLHLFIIIWGVITFTKDKFQMNSVN